MTIKRSIELSGLQPDSAVPKAEHTVLLAAIGAAIMYGLPLLAAWLLT